MKFSFKKTLLNVLVAMAYIKSVVNVGSNQNDIHRKTFSNNTQLLPLVSQITHRHLQKEFHRVSRFNSLKCLDDFLLSNSSKKYERCGDYLLSKLVTTCLPKWSLDNHSLCTRIEKSPSLSKCPEGWVHLGHTCVKDQVKIREMVCDNDFLLINNTTCERLYYDKPLPRCNQGYIFSPTTFMCEKWQTDFPTVVRSLPLSSINTVTTKRIAFPFLMCHSNAISRGKNCITYSYTRPQYKCENGLILDNMNCIKIKERCVTKNTFPQLCLHSIPPQKKKNGSIVRPNCIKNTQDKLTYCCPKAYKLYKSDYDVRCIYTSSVSQCLTSLDSFYSPDAFCKEKPIPAIPFCQQGKYNKQLQLCEISETKEPLISCPETFQYDKSLNQCVQTTELLLSECNEDTKNCTESMDTSDMVPIGAMNTTRLLPQKFVDRKHATWICPPNSTRIKNFQNMNSAHSFLCEKKEKRSPSLQCPDHFHEGIENVCVRQIFSPLLRSCPIGFQLVNEECVKILKSAPVSFCSHGFTVSTLLTLKINETEGKQPAVCVMQLT